MKFITPALVSLLLMASSAQAQPIWTFEQVLQSALDSHPVIMGKHSAQVAARADQKGAEWLRYPTPSIEAATQGSGKDSGLVRIEQPLWSGGRITAAIEASGKRLGAADAAVDEARRDTSLKVIAAYTEALRQKAKQQFAQTGFEEHGNLLDMIRRRVAQEVSSLADQHLAESRTYLAANDLSLANQAYSNALVQLSQLGGKPVADISEQGVSALGAPASLETALSQALGYSPTLRRLTYEEEAANADIDSKRSAYMPQLSLRLEKSVGQTQASSAMLVLQAQPGAGLSAGDGVDAAISRREIVRLAREAAERDLRDSVALDWNEWVAARMRLENAKLTSAMSTEVFESYRRQYVIGRKSWIEVLNAVREATQSQFSVKDASTQTIAASLRLRVLTGQLNLNEGAKP